MTIDWSKTIKKSSFTAAQALTSLLFSLAVTGKVIALLAMANIAVTPDQVTAVLAGAIAGLLELIRNSVKQKFNLAWL